MYNDYGDCSFEKAVIEHTAHCAELQLVFLWVVLVWKELLEVV